MGEVSFAALVQTVEHSELRVSNRVVGVEHGIADVLVIDLLEQCLRIDADLCGEIVDALDLARKRWRDRAVLSLPSKVEERRHVVLVACSQASQICKNVIEEVCF